MKFLLEIKNRFVLLFIFWFYLFFIFYFYKETLFFLLAYKILINKNFLYTTNIMELFITYLKIINFITNQLLFGFSFYSLFLFLIPALKKIEFVIFKNLITFYLISSFLIFIIVKNITFPLSWLFFENFQKKFITNNSLYFEIKIIDYFNFFIKIYLLTQFYFIYLLLLTSVIKLLNIEAKKYRKFIIYIFFIFFFYIFNLLDQILIFILFLFFYEFIVLTIIFIKNFRIK